MRDLDLEDLAAGLAEFAPAEKRAGPTAQEERLMAGFEDIQRFVRSHGRLPQAGEERDIFERLYAVRLARLRALPKCRALLAPLDETGLLGAADTPPAPDVQALDLDALAAELGDSFGEQDITVLRHVRPQAQRRAVDEIADRKPCEDFAAFAPLFAGVREDLDSGLRQARPFGKHAAIEVGQWFILDGQTAYVAGQGEEFDSPQGKKDARLRVIFSNGTESNLLRLSLVRALYKDESARRITEPDAGPLFGDVLEADDVQSGTIYVLRSLSDHPYVAEHREVIHKIGVTGGKVEARIAGAERDASYLLAKVQVVATYQLANINRARLEKLLHRLFAPARIDLALQDRFGHAVKPQEWFLLPLAVIDEAVRAISDGSITRLRYDVASAALVPAE